MQRDQLPCIHTFIHVIMLTVICSVTKQKIKIMTILVVHLNLNSNLKNSPQLAMQFSCPYSKELNSSLSQAQQHQNHVVSLLLSSFVSPFKILHMLDPTQADAFKQRNPSSGCCASPHIAIPQDQLTPTQKMLRDMLTPQQVRLHLDGILSMCQQKMDNIVAKGKEDGLKVDKEVEKFLLDKVLAESSNLYFYEKLKELVRSEGGRMAKEMGLWATPASWKQKYPGVELQFLSGQQMGELMGRGWTVIKSIVKNSKRLKEEVSLLEKDGKFQQKPWGRDQKGGSQGQKLMSTPEKYAEMETSGQSFLFPALREAVMVISSLPFELNQKANLFCSVSPHLHLCYSSSPFAGEWVKEEFRFTVILIASEQVKVQIQGGQELELCCGDLIVLDNQKHRYRLQSESNSFLFRNFIGIVGK